MPYLYTPEQILQTVIFPGSVALGYKFATSRTAYRLNGVWATTSVLDSTVAGQCDYVFNRPTVVSDDVAAELQAYGVGTLNHIT